MSPANALPNYTPAQYRPSPVGGDRVLITEVGAATYNADILIPGGAIITSIIVQAVALWDAVTSAEADVGDYACTVDPLTGAITVGSALDADGFFVDVDLKATDLTAAQSISLYGLYFGGVQGAYSTGTNTHWNSLYAAAHRVLRCQVVSVGAGTAGRTIFAATWINPAVDQQV